MLIKEHQLSQGMDLSLTIKRGLVHLAERVGLNAIDLSHDPGNILVEPCGHLTAKVVSRLYRCIMAPIFASGGD